MADVKETLHRLVGEVQDCGCDVTDVVEMNYVENDVLIDHLIANGVTLSTEVEELEADNERLRNMWAKAVSDASKAQAENKVMKVDIYPLVIVRDRYTGTYSGGKYTAWNNYVDEIPQEIEGNDGECREFWWSDAAGKYTVGKGATIVEAVVDLIKRMKERRTE